MTSDDEFLALYEKALALHEKRQRYFGSDPVNQFVGEHPRIVAARETIRAADVAREGGICAADLSLLPTGG